MSKLQHQKGWAALKNAKEAFCAWSVRQGIAVQQIEHVATFEDWDKNSEIYIFFPTDADLARHKSGGTIPEMEKAYLSFLTQVGYPLDRFPVRFIFDSHENVEKNYAGSYFNRLR